LFFWSQKMTVFEAVAKRSHELAGRPIGLDEADLLRRFTTPHVPEWLIGLESAYRLCGTCFSLPRSADPSGLGVEMRWMAPKDTCEEVTDFYPGIAAAPLGYLPVGTCERGSGDPYFINVNGGEDPPLVRIPHEAVGREMELLVSQVEVVAEKLTAFFEHARIVL
jgi:hypothetical protein